MPQLAGMALSPPSVPQARRHPVIELLGNLRQPQVSTLRNSAARGDEILLEKLA
jgi:hypothetical protein